MYRTYGAWQAGIAGARTVQECTGLYRSGQEWTGVDRSTLNPQKRLHVTKKHTSTYFTTRLKLYTYTNPGVFCAL